MRYPMCLRAVRLSGAVFFDIHAAEPWVAETPLGRSVVHAMFPGSEHMISYHVILEGSCWAIVEGEPPVHLSAGDVIVFPHGDTHVLTSTPGMRKKPNMSMYRRPTEGQLPFTISMGADACRTRKSAGAKAAGARRVRVDRDGARATRVREAEHACGVRAQREGRAVSGARISSAVFSAATRGRSTLCSRRFRASIRVSDDASGTLGSRTCGSRSRNRRCRASAARACWGGSAS